MLNYPALLDMATQKLHPIGGSESFLVGRNETADICILDPACSRHHFRVLRCDGQYHVECLSVSNPIWCNGQLVTGPTRLRHGDTLQAGQTRFQFLLSPSDVETKHRAASVPPPPEFSTVMATSAPSGDVLCSTPFELAGVMLIGREKEQAQIHLPHPQVSRRHARIAMEGTTAKLTDLNSANGTYVNGQRIRDIVSLQPGDQLDIGPYALQFTGTSLIPRPRSDNVELVARGIKRVVKNRETGQPLQLLDDITLVIRPKEFVCLLGPSGSGKSTLLSTMSGRAGADEGAVLLNGKDLHANFEALKQDIAVVPQKDILHESLAIDQALWYTAKLRLPPDTSAAEITKSLDEMLETVGLTARRGTVIRHLSGGQVKRASLANEILCKPSLLFLDEVTSGLDEQTDREVMNLFRMLADAGKTVVCITHSLANVERTCHLVVILTSGGKLAFVGKPTEALEYFKIDRLGDVYDRLAEHKAEHWQQAFLQSPHWHRYVTDRLPPEIQSQPHRAWAPAERVTERVTMFLRQTILLTSRYAVIWRGDYLSLLAMAAQAVVVALLLGVLFGNLDELPRQADLEKRDYAHAPSA